MGSPSRRPGQSKAEISGLRPRLSTDTAELDQSLTGEPVVPDAGRGRADHGLTPTAAAIEEVGDTIGSHQQHPGPCRLPMGRSRGPRQHSIPPRVVPAIIEFAFVDLAREPPRVGKALERELSGLFGAHRGLYRLLYGIDDDVKRVCIVHIATARMHTARVEHTTYAPLDTLDALARPSRVGRDTRSVPLTQNYVRTWSGGPGTPARGERVCVQNDGVPTWEPCAAVPSADMWMCWMSAAAADAECNAIASTQMGPCAYQATVVYGAILPQQLRRFPRQPGPEPARTITAVLYLREVATRRCRASAGGNTARTFSAPSTTSPSMTYRQQPGRHSKPFSFSASSQ